MLRLEDLYLPFKPKKKSLAAAAREKGLEPLGLAIWHSDPAVANLDGIAAIAGESGEAAQHDRGSARPASSTSWRK